MLTKARYDTIRTWFLLHPRSLNLLRALNAWLPRVMYCVYPLLLAALALNGDARFWRVLLVPAAALGAVTALRLLWDLPRPYETLDIEPLIPREKKGRSFPSRHMASATIIAVACWYVCAPAGIVMAVIALLIAVIRPLAGIHFPRDMLAGMLVGLAIGVIGFWLV